MIFVTVGTTQFDALIQLIDNAIEQKEIIDEVTAQIGTGKYVPKHITAFRFCTSLQPFLKRAELVISHGGAGTIFECLTVKKKLIVVANPRVRGEHQQELALELSRRKHLLWCPSLNHVVECIHQAKTTDFREYTSPKSTIAQKILEFLDQG